MVDFPRAGCLVAMIAGGCGRIGFRAGVDGGGNDGGDSGAPCTALICDSFDVAGIDPMWMIDTTRGSIAVDTSRAHRGISSVHVQTQQIATAITEPHAVLLGYRGLGAPTQTEGNITGTIYTRAWMYFASPQPTVLFEQVINFADLPGNGISVGAKMGYMAVNDYTAPAYMQSVTELLPLDRWTCLQMEMASGTTATTRLFVDGIELADVALAKSIAQPRPTHVYLGLDWIGTTANQGAADAWIDDVIVDSAPHTCAE